MKCQAIRCSCAQASIAFAGELGPMVGDDQVRPAAPGDDGVEFAGGAPPGDRGVGDRRQAFLGDVVDDIENAEAPAARKLVVDKVDRPARVRTRLGQNRRPRSGGALPALALATVRPSSR
jgi:hypothetical protein